MTKSLVTDFGADPTFASDSTAAINAALACVTDEVIWDVGRYKACGLLQAFSGGSHRGAPNLTTVQTVRPTGDLLSVRGAGFSMKGVGFVSGPPRTGGAMIAILDGTTAFHLQDYVIANGFDGIHIYPGAGSASLNFDNGSIRDCAPGLGSSFLIEQGLAVKVDGLSVDNGTQILSAFQVRNCGDIELAHSNLIHGGFCVLLNVGAGCSVCSFWAHDTFFDTSNYGLFANAYGGGSIMRSRSANCWYSSAAQGGVWLGADATSLIDGFDFINPHILFSKGNGFETAGTGANVRNVALHGPKISNGAAPGLNSGIAVADGTFGFQAIGGHVGVVAGGAGFEYGMWFYGALPKGVVRDVAVYDNLAPYNAVPSGVSVFAPVT